MTSYTIPDEPARTRFGHLVVRPSAPFLAAMLCGQWLSLPWFAFNGYAMGSPTWRKEAAMCALSFGVTVALSALYIYLWQNDIIESTTVQRLFLLGIATWKFLMGYWIQFVQSRTFHVYEYYGGQVRSSRAVIAAGYFATGFLLSGLDDFWSIIVSGVV